MTHLFLREKIILKQNLKGIFTAFGSAFPGSTAHARILLHSHQSFYIPETRKKNSFLLIMCSPKKAAETNVQWKMKSCIDLYSSLTNQLKLLIELALHVPLNRKLGFSAVMQLNWKKIKRKKSLKYGISNWETNKTERFSLPLVASPFYWYCIKIPYTNNKKNSF